MVVWIVGKKLSTKERKKRKIELTILTKQYVQTTRHTDRTASLIMQRSNWLGQRDLVRPASTEWQTWKHTRWLADNSYYRVQHFIV